MTATLRLTHYFPKKQCQTHDVFPILHCIFNNESNIIPGNHESKFWSTFNCNIKQTRMEKVTQHLQADDEWENEKIYCIHSEIYIL